MRIADHILEIGIAIFLLIAIGAHLLGVDPKTLLGL